MSENGKNCSFLYNDINIYVQHKKSLAAYAKNKYKYVFVIFSLSLVATGVVFPFLFLVHNNSVNIPVVDICF